MKLSIENVKELLSIIESNQLSIIVQELGPDFLTEYDKHLLKQYGVDFTKLYQPDNSSIYTSFHFGMLAEALGKQEASKITYDNLKLHVREGRYLPISTRQQATLDNIKAQSFASLKTLKGKIFTDVYSFTNALGSQQEALALQLKEGLENRKTVSQIANAIAEQTGDWGRNFDRIIETASQAAFEQGKVAEIERRNPGRDPFVYKIVQPGACRHCIRLFLTKGMGSQPTIFKLSELKANGSNIGRPASEWKATIDPIHPHCRCPLFELPEGFLWDREKHSFSKPDPYYIKQVVTKRQLIRVVIGGKEHFL